MQTFDYVLPQTVAEAVAFLQQPEGQTHVFAGGTDLIVQIREGRKNAKLLVDIKSIFEVNELSYDREKGLTLGAAVPCHKITGDKTIAQAYPGLIDGIGIIGGVQIQGRASVGGNLCNASPAADSIPALIIHQAVCVIAGPRGQRQLPVEQFCIGVGKTALQKDEILVALKIPAPPKNFGAHYLRFIPRNEMDIAVVGAGAAIVLDEKKQSIVSARIALGAVAPTPLLVAEAGAALVGKKISEEAIRAAAQIAKAAAKPITDLRGSAAQRKHLAEVLTRRAIEGALDRAQTMDPHR